MRRFTVILLVLSLWTSMSYAKEPAIVVTIAPLHSLVQSVLGKSADAELLVRGTNSPHGFQLKPSHMSKIRNAEVVFFISDGLEPFVEKALHGASQTPDIIELIAEKKLRALPNRSGGVWQAHHDHVSEGTSEDDHNDHEHKHGHEAHEKHGDAGEHHDHALHDDPHIWLDPANAISMVDVIQRVLIQKFPENDELLSSNAEALRVKLQLLDANLGQKLSEVSAIPYVVLHDAYQYLEKRYRLNAVGSVQVTAGQQISVKRVKELKSLIAERGAKCLFREPQFTDRILDVLAEDAAVRIATLDPMGSQIAIGEEHYFQMQIQLVDNLRSCLLSK